MLNSDLSALTSGTVGVGDIAPEYIQQNSCVYNEYMCNFIFRFYVPTISSLSATNVIGVLPVHPRTQQCISAWYLDGNDVFKSASVFVDTDGKMYQHEGNIPSVIVWCCEGTILL